MTLREKQSLFVKQGQLSDNFWRSEFACRCGCGHDTVDAELVRVLERLRELCGNRPMVISSGCRCEVHNKKVSESKNSFHVKGKAADIYIPGVDNDFIADCAEDIFMGSYGIIRYIGFTHIDVRDGFYRDDRRL